METNTVTQEQFIDLFGTGAAKVSGANQGFTNDGIKDTDIFSVTDTTTVVSASTTDTTTVAPSSTTDTTTADPSSTTDTTTVAVDLFADEKGKAGRKPKYDFSDMAGYFEDRVKSGKFVKIEEDAEDGSKVAFIPKTPEDFDEVIDLQVNYRLDQEKKAMVQQIYQSKSPAWQTVLKYSELVDDPSEILPFIQGVKTIESVAQVDEGTEEGAEKIIRVRLEQKGDTEELIDEQIEALRGADKLLSTAKVYKPMIIQNEQRQLSEMIRQKEEDDRGYLQMVAEIEKNALKEIESPIIGKQKLSKEEKALVYEMIAYPSEETKGYPIFNAIDALFAKGDFQTLKMIALLAGGKKDSFINYVSTGAADKTANDFQRKLRVVGSTSIGKDDVSSSDQVPVVNRNRYTGGFGRG